jgi:hypothetical protein
MAKQQNVAVQQQEELTPSQYARRKKVTLGYIYSLLQGDRLTGARKSDGRWLIPADAVAKQK